MMNESLSLFIVLPTLLALFALSALFSGSETALFSLTPIQIREMIHRNPRVGRRVEGLMKHPSLTLSTLLVGNTFVNFATASLAYILLNSLTPTYAEIISVPLVTLLLLLFGEVTPKRIAVDHAVQLAPFCSAYIRFWSILLRPFAVVMGASTKLFRRALRRERRRLNDDELLTVVEISANQGVLDDEEASMVDGVIRLADLKASDEMIPRVEMDFVDLDDPLEKNLARARHAMHRFLPACRGTPDAVLGFLDVPAWLLDPTHDIRKALRPALFVPENLPLDKLLKSFRARERKIACVLDEYGGTAGIITQSDILDLVASNVPERSDENEEIHRIGDTTWTVAGTTSIDEINHTLDLELSADDADRISGWMTFHAERIPYPGMIVEAQGIRAIVTGMRRRAIRSVRLTVLPREADTSDLKKIFEAEDREEAENDEEATLS